MKKRVLYGVANYEELVRKNFLLTLPNLNMRQIFVEYFNELHPEAAELQFIMYCVGNLGFRVFEASQ